VDSSLVSVLFHVGFLFCIAFKQEDFKVAHDYQEWMVCK